MPVSPLEIGAVATGVTLGAFALRDIFARVAIRRACKEAAPDIAQFEKDNTYVSEPGEEAKAAGTVLRKIIQGSRKMRETVLDRVQEIKIPDPNIPMGLEDLQEKMVANKHLFLKIMGESYGEKVGSLYVDQVKYRLSLVRKAAAARKAAQKAAGVAAGMARASAASADSAGDIYQSISEQSAPHLDAFEKKVVDLLDQIGIIDPSVEIAEKVHDFFAQNFGETAAHHLGASADFLSSLHHIPGVFQGAMSLSREFSMLMNDETSLGDSFIDGGVPIFIRSIGIKIGMVLDGMTGGTSFGAFTFLGSWTSKRISNEFLEERNEGLREELQRLKDEIAACHARVLKTINSSVHDFETGFVCCVEKCPDINEEKTLKGFMSELTACYADGLKTAEITLGDKTQTAIGKIPPNTWVDRVLFIDRHGAVKKLYLEAQRAINSKHSGLVHHFSLAAEEHAENGVDFLIRNVVFDTPETVKTLSNIETVAEKSAQNYTESLTGWEEETIEFRRKGSEEVADVIHVQGEIYKEFVDERRPTMNAIARKIQANNRRQGKKPEFAAA